MKLLFVCMGNICRSPAAEEIMRVKLSGAGLADKVVCDSAGTTAYHSGEKADARMREHGSKRGYNLSSLSRQFQAPDDFTDFDLILVMDHDNWKGITHLDQPGKYKNKIKFMTDFCSKENPGVVPDPYYGGDQGFENVYNILEDACDGLLKSIQKKII